MNKSRIITVTPEECDRARCELVDGGYLNEIIAGYVALAFKQAGVEAPTAATMAGLYDAYNAKSALDESRRLHGIRRERWTELSKI